jgi:hypothetical protein
LPWTFRSTEIEDKKVDKNGLGRLGRMAKNGQMAIYHDLCRHSYVDLIALFFCVDLKLASIT